MRIEDYKQYVLNLDRSGSTSSMIADRLFEEHGFECHRATVSRALLRWKKPDPDIDTVTETTTNQYANDNEAPLMLDAWDRETGRMMDIDAYCEFYGLPREDVQSYKFCSNTGTPYYNIAFKQVINTEVAKEINYDFFEEVVKKYIKTEPTPEPTIHFKSDTISRIVLTDIHVGMTPNEDGRSLYGGKWNIEELMKRAEAVCTQITLLGGSGNVLIIDDLGDFLDGWDGETVRKGHKLPQNMDNQASFDAAVTFKMKILGHAVQLFDSVFMNNICDDNHSGSFGYITNSAVKQIAEAKYSNVHVVNHEKFINYYTVGSHCFMISHGKDGKNLKFGFKPQLDDKQISKIDSWMKENKLYGKAEFFHFCKGDSHQSVFDDTTSQDFDYWNYPAFSPSSEWVQANFQKGRSGFVVEQFPIDRDEITRTKHWFEWES